MRVSYVVCVFKVCICSLSGMRMCICLWGVYACVVCMVCVWCICDVCLCPLNMCTCAYVCACMYGEVHVDHSGCHSLWPRMMDSFSPALLKFMFNRLWAPQTTHKHVTQSYKLSWGPCSSDVWWPREEVHSGCLAEELALVCQLPFSWVQWSVFCPAYYQLFGTTD